MKEITYALMGRIQDPKTGYEYAEDGQVTPLAITHLRGNVTAAGKLTTTWGELKGEIK